MHFICMKLAIEINLLLYNSTTTTGKIMYLKWNCSKMKASTDVATSLLKHCPIYLVVGLAYIRFNITTVQVHAKQSFSTNY